MTKEERIKTFENLMLSTELDLIDIRYLEERLDNIGFFIAPASINHHGNYEGGLFDHSYTVTKALIDLTKKLNLQWQKKRSPYIVGILHDLCKCDNYIFDEDVHQWTYNKNNIITGHGELSVILAQQIITLTPEEVLCIRWHMGAYDDKENWNILGRAIERCPNVLYTHTADMIASRIKGI